jgi:energy-coupling factor transporter ATP-binding protein EcfA2
VTNTILVKGLRFAYPALSPDAPASWVLDGLDLHAKEGEWLAVMGASDVGKTTLCLLLAGLAPHLTSGRLEGRAVVAGLDASQRPPPALVSTVGLLFQEPEAQLFNPTVEAEIAWGLENLGLPASEISSRVNEMLALFHLDHTRHRAPTDLSGGEKKRAALASVLAMRPSVLILDEPMGGLDPAGRQEVLTALTHLRHDRSVTIVMTESDPEAVAAFADRLLVLDQGRIALEGLPRALFGQGARMAALGVAVPQLAGVATTLNERLGADFEFLTVGEAQEALREKEELTTVWPSPPPPQRSSGQGERANNALEVAGLRFWYDDQNALALRGVDLAVPRGQFVALVGANGSGKTTLAKHFNGLLRPKHGRVSVHGLDVADRSVGELARQVGFLFQHPEQQIFSATVRQELAFGPRNLGLPATETEARVRAALTHFALAAVADKPPAILGYGLRRRVTLASLATMDPPVLVLDEPAVGLDATGLRETFAWLASLHAQGRTILLITHDMALVAQYAERVVVLHQGQVIADGAPASIFRQAALLAHASLAPPPTIALARALHLPGDCLTIDAFCDEYIERYE